MLLSVLGSYIKFIGGGIHKIRFNLKQEHNIEISHQSIENILLRSDINLTIKIGFIRNITYLSAFELKLTVNEIIF